MPRPFTRVPDKLSRPVIYTQLLSAGLPVSSDAGAPPARRTRSCASFTLVMLDNDPFSRIHLKGMTPTNVPLAPRPGFLEYTMSLSAMAISTLWPVTNGPPAEPERSVEALSSRNCSVPPARSAMPASDPDQWHLMIVTTLAEPPTGWPPMFI